MMAKAAIRSKHDQTNETAQNDSQKMSFGIYDDSPPQ